METGGFVLIIIGTIVYFYGRQTKKINWLAFGLFVFGVGTGMLIAAGYFLFTYMKVLSSGL